MKFLVAISCFLAVAAAKPTHSHYSVGVPTHLGLGEHAYSYSTYSAHTPVIHSPVLAYNSIPALSHYSQTIKSGPVVGYKTEITSPIVGHETTLAHQDNTVHHGAALVHEVAPAVEVKTIHHNAPLIHERAEIVAYNTVPNVHHSVFTQKTAPIVAYETEIASPVVSHQTVESVKTVATHHDTTVEHGALVQEVAPAVEVKSIPALKYETTHSAPLVKTAISTPVYTAAKISSHDNTVVHPTAYAAVHHEVPVVHHEVHHTVPIVHEEIHHETPVIAYNSAISSPVFSHAGLATHQIVTHPTAYSVEHHSVVGAPVGYTHHGLVATPEAIGTHLGFDKTQYHAQDFVGQASYGHSEALQHHHAAQDASGNKLGSFGWVAPNGQFTGGKYVADSLGYRIHSNVLPVGPVPVSDTPEVIAARSAHFAAYDAIKARHLV